jgi:predicted RNA binding protein YcfA (HicA-like mRNA interferase family)
VKLPRNISGDRLAGHICRHWDYTRIKQVGSHIMLRTETPTRSKQVIPAHTPMRIGTFSKIISQIALHKQVTREDILRDLGPSS